MNGDGDAADVRMRLVAVMEGYGWDLPRWLLADVGRIFTYMDAGRDDEERREMLKSGLFVRCATAVLCGGCTDLLEVEAGAAGACEYNEVTQVLQINVGLCVKREENDDDDTEELGCDGPTGVYTRLLQSISSRFSCRAFRCAVHTAAVYVSCAIGLHTDRYMSWRLHTDWFCTLHTAPRLPVLLTSSRFCLSLDVSLLACVPATHSCHPDISWLVLQCAPEPSRDVPLSTFCIVPPCLVTALACCWPYPHVQQWTARRSSS